MTSTITRRTKALGWGLGLVHRGVSYTGYSPSSERASHVLSKVRKSGTRCEHALARALRTQGLRFQRNVRAIAGSPDFVFRKDKVLVFCDGDFWHGRNWAKRMFRLATGANSSYWLAKIQSNIARDNRIRRALRTQGWSVIRCWETDVLRNPARCAARISRILQKRTVNRRKDTKEERHGRT